MKKYLIYIFIFILALGIRAYGIAQKDYLHYDEAFTFLCANPSNLSPENEFLKVTWSKFLFKKDKDYSMQEFKHSLYSMPAKTTLRDLKTLRNNSIDKDHTNLYYSLFRVWNIGLDGEYKTSIVRATTLNLAFFCISFFFMFKLLNLIRPDDKKFISLGLLFAYLCSGTISNTLFLREYALSEMAFVVSTYFGVLICKKIANDENMSFKELFLSSVVFAILGLSAYFSVIYDGFLCLAILCTCIYFKNYKSIKNLVIMVILSNIIILLIYPAYYNGIFSNTYSQGFQNLMNSMSENKRYIFTSYVPHRIDGVNYSSYLFYTNIISIIALTLIAGFLFNKKTNLFFSKTSKISPDFSPIFFILLSMIAWNIFILKLATPYPPTRFVSPSFPLLTLTYLILLYPLRNYLVILFSSLFLFCTCYPIFINPTSVSPVSVSNIHKGSVGFRKYPQDTIDKLVAEGIFEPAPQRSTGYILSPKYPVIVLGTTYFYPYYYFVYLGNKGTIRFTEKLPTSDFPYKKFFIIRYSIFNDAQQQIWDSYKYKIPLTSQEAITSQIYFVSLD